MRGDTALLKMAIFFTRNKQMVSVLPTLQIKRSKGDATKKIKSSDLHYTTTTPTSVQSIGTIFPFQ